MKNYTIYCTSEQTKKALELGAPIGYASIKEIGLERYVSVDNEEYALPTTEEMIGWLEDKGIMIDIIHQIDGYCLISVASDTEQIKPKIEGSIYRKVATIAAIDAALEYLENNEKIKSKNSTV